MLPWMNFIDVEQGLRNGTMSIRLSVCPIYQPLQQRAAGLQLWARRTGDIDRLLLRAVSRCQLTYEAERRLVRAWVSINDCLLL